MTVPTSIKTSGFLLLLLYIAWVRVRGVRWMVMLSGARSVVWVIVLEGGARLEDLSRVGGVKEMRWVRGEGVKGAVVV